MFDAVRITADLSWELDTWGRLRRQTEAARFDWQGREEDGRDAVLSLVSSVALTGLQLRELDQSTVLAERTLASRGSGPRRSISGGSCWDRNPA